MEEDPVASLPLSRTWLNDIVDALADRPNGTAEVDAIVIAIEKRGREMGAAPKETVTRTINNFSSDADDSGRAATHDLFERVGPNRYRLRSYPQRPDLVEIQAVAFDKYEYRRIWEYICQKHGKDERWRAAGNRKKLGILAKAVAPDGPLHALFLVHQKTAATFSDDTELDL